MKLSRLVFECVKDSINLPNTNINEYGFLNGDFNYNKDYVNQISGVFGAINLALSRLQNSDKIPYSTEMVEQNNNIITFDKGEIINVVKLYRDTFKRYAFRTLQNGSKYLVFSDTELPKELMVEYRPTIPHFTHDDLKPVYEVDGDIIDNNIDLKDYGINDVMCNYIKEFVKGVLLEYMAPDLANLHTNRAEQYLQVMKQASTSFYQNNVRNVQGRLF